MFERIKRMFGRKSSPAPTVAWEKPAAASVPASGRAVAPPPPPLASSRNYEPPVATRGRSAAVMGPPSTESVMAAKRQQTAATPTPPAAADNRRVVKSFQRGERTDAKSFVGIATGGGERDLRRAKAREVQLRTRHGMEDGINLLHRTGSVTELHLSKEDSSVAAAKHHSKTTGQTFEVRAREMRGPAKRQLDKIARRHDSR